MGNIIDDVKDKLLENADETLLEGTKVVRDFVTEVAADIDQHKKQATAAAMIAATIAAGGAAAMDDDADMEAAYEAMRSPNPIVLDISDPPADVDDEDRSKESSAEVVAEVSEKGGVREFISKVVITPIYMIGSGLLMIVKGIAVLAQVPVLGALVKWGVIAAAILATLAIAFKIAFPDVPLSKILNKKCVSFVFITVAVISVGCEVATWFYPKAGMWIDLAQVLGGFGILVSIYVAVARVFSRKRKQA